jgi:hypothetical protein
MQDDFKDFLKGVCVCVLCFGCTSECVCSVVRLCVVLFSLLSSIIYFIKTCVWYNNMVYDVLFIVR